MVNKTLKKKVTKKLQGKKPTIPTQIIVPTKLQYNTLCELYPRLASKFVCAEHLIPKKPGRIGKNATAKEKKAYLELKQKYRKSADEIYILMQMAWQGSRLANRTSSRIKTLPLTCKECCYFSVRYHPMFRKRQSAEDIAAGKQPELLPILGRCVLWEKQVMSGMKTSMVNVVCNDTACTRGIKGKQVSGDIAPHEITNVDNMPLININGTDYSVIK